MSDGCSGGSGSGSGFTGPTGGGGAQYGAGKTPPLWAWVAFLTFHLIVFALIAYAVSVPDNCPCTWTFSNGSMQYRDRRSPLPEPTKPKYRDRRSPLPEPTKPSGLLADLINRIKSKKGFIVTFDQAGGKFNDSGWTGNTDPMGTLKAGETYQVTYSGNTYTTRGFNEGSNSVISATYGNATPDEGKISLWGRVYTFDETGNVYDPQIGLVGTLRFGETPPF